MTIRKRLGLWYSGLVTIIIIMLCLAVIMISRVSILNTIDQLLEQTAHEIDNNITIMPVGEFSTLDDRVMVRGADIFKAPGQSIQIWQTHDGSTPIEPELLQTSLDQRGTTVPLDPHALSATALHYAILNNNGVSSRVVSLPFDDPVTEQQLGIIQVSTPMQAVDQTNRSLVFVTFIAALISILVSGALSFWLSGHMLKPIEQITQAAASVAKAKDLTTRMRWDGPMDELGRLTDVFNHMMERLEKLFTVQQRFVGDVSHELRTPLTSILGNLELMERYGYDHESVEAIHREAARMSRMVNDLLFLARADYGELEVELNPIDIDPIALEVYEQALVLAKGRNLNIQLDPFDGARINGNSDRMKQLLLNLVSNAIKFTPDEGSIRVGVYPQGNEAVVEVADTGIGISKEDQIRMFDRFFQADNSRVHRTDMDGAGLGLSIAQWIVGIHNGRLTVDSEVEGGTRFKIFFPLLDPATHKTSPSLSRHYDD